VARQRPSGLKATPGIQPPRGYRRTIRWRGGAAMRSNRRTVPSSPAAASSRPSGLAASAVAEPANVRSVSPDGAAVPAIYDVQIGDGVIPFRTRPAADGSVLPDVTSLTSLAGAGTRPKAPTG
jgi:hypothetical protein